MTSRLGSLFLLSLLGLAGCAGDDALVPIACTGAQVCPPPSPLMNWSAQLIPGSATPGSQLTPQDVPQFTFQADGTARLQFSQAAQLRGSVYDDQGHAVARARVIAILATAIPGQNPYSFETATDSSGSFSLRVPVPQSPQQPYRLWIGFDDAAQAAAHPPLWQLVTITGDKTLAIGLRPMSALASIHGRIVDPLGNGVPGLRVQVLDGHGDIVSTTATSADSTSGENQAGTFRLLVDPALASDMQFQVVVWPGQQNAGVPNLVQMINRPAVQTDLQVNFTLPAYPNPLSFQLAVRGIGTSGANMPVVGARVQAQAYLNDPLLQKLGQTATYITSGQADQQGLVTLSLVPATMGSPDLLYTVTVTSPAQSPFASTVQTLQVGYQAGVLSPPIMLPLRAQLSGRLLGQDGSPVSGAQVVAHSITGDGQGVSMLGGVVLEAVTPQALTGTDGRFALRLDQGDYDLDLVPVPGTQPRFSLDNLRVVTDDIDVGSVRLPGPALAKVLVVGPDSYPAPGANLRVFQLPDTTPRPGSSCDSLLPCSNVARLRADVFTNDDGRVEFLLPAIGP